MTAIVKHVLPIGSVVNVKNNDIDLMIVSQYPSVTIEGTDGYFEFGAVTLPLGLVKQELIFFNKEDIVKVVFVGYIDVKFQEFLEKHEMLQDTLQLPKHVVSTDS